MPPRFPTSVNSSSRTARTATTRAPSSLSTGPGKTIFVVNEGEYQMMNTLDLTIDQAFHELHYSPWTVRNELDFFVSRYSFRDLHGLTFLHDQGVADCFTRPGFSSYELPNLTGMLQLHVL